MRKKPETPCRACKQLHLNRPVAGERIVVVPKAKGSPGWAYSTDPQKGVVVATGHTVYKVTMDFDGKTREIAAVNVKRSCGWKPSPPGRRPVAAFRPPPPLRKGRGRSRTGRGAAMRRALAVVAVLALVAGCGGGPSKNQDPRKGRVVTRDTSCAWGSCEHDWKVCIGPDLLLHFTGVDDHTVEGSPECRPDPTPTAALHAGPRDVIPRPVSRSSERPPVGAVRPATNPGEPTASQWAELRECEAGGDYTANTGNGYYGAYQFDVSTWTSVGGTGLPSDATAAEQDRLALTLWRDRGSQPWPYCGRYLR